MRHQIIGILPTYLVRLTLFHMLTFFITLFQHIQKSSIDGHASALCLNCLGCLDDFFFFAPLFDWQARPAIELHENKDDEKNKEKEEDEKDLSIPGSSYVKLIALTASSVLPRKLLLSLVLTVCILLYPVTESSEIGYNTVVRNTEYKWLKDKNAHLQLSCD